jgi:hypothetical protein
MYGESIKMKEGIKMGYQESYVKTTNSKDFD